MQREYLLNEKPAKALLVFAFPMILGNLFQQLYTMADSIVVGQFVSEDALAAVGASYSLTNVFIAVAIGGGVGASVITSRYFGAREYGKMKRSAYTALISFLIASVVLGALGYLFSHQAMTALKTPENILLDATRYLDIYFLGLPFLFIYNVVASMFNALGRSKVPLFLLIFSSVFNVGLDIYMVRNLGMGVAGVAWATLIAQGISAILALVLFLRELTAYHGDSPGLFNPGEVSDMSRIAGPSILQQSAVSIGMLLVQSVVNSFGSQAVAGYTSGMRIETFCVVPMGAMGNAISSYTAQNLGAGAPQRVRQGYKAAYCIVGVFALIIFSFLQLFSTQLITMFIGQEGTPIAMETGVSFLRFMSWFFVVIGLKLTTDGLLRGAGDMKVFTIANMVNLLVRVVMAITLAPRYGIAMIWYAVPIGWGINYLISVTQYRTGKWTTTTKPIQRPELEEA